jgi:hypothetical protein
MLNDLGFEAVRSGLDVIFSQRQRGKLISTFRIGQCSSFNSCCLRTECDIGSTNESSILVSDLSLNYGS